LSRHPPNPPLVEEADPKRVKSVKDAETKICYNISTMAKRLSYFWDYKLNENDLKNILAGNNEIKKRWAVARLVESAPLDEVWKYINLKELQEIFPYLKLKEPIRKVWEKALKVWNQ
jgi:hypothetical protein